MSCPARASCILPAWAISPVNPAHADDFAERADRRRFELLKRAYVEARYSDQYEISLEDLDGLTAQAQHLRDLVDQACQAHLADLSAKAASAPAAPAQP